MDMKIVLRCTARQELEETKQILPKTKDEKPSSEQVVNCQVGFESVDPLEDKDHLNAKSWDGTTNGKMSLGNLIRVAGEEFSVGKEYIVEITEVPTPTSSD